MGAIETIAKLLNLDANSFLFVDDQMFEIEEVRQKFPAIMTSTGQNMEELAGHPRLSAGVDTEVGRSRRQLYAQNLERTQCEETFEGTNIEFLRSLKMRFKIFVPEARDLERASELTLRTNQLNTTAYSFSLKELQELNNDPQSLLLMASLEDRFGSYGLIGLAVIQKRVSCWTIRLLLMSCRVMSRGVGAVMLNRIIERARAAGAATQAEYMPNGKNRIMLVTYKFSGFREIKRTTEKVLLEYQADEILVAPDYLEVEDSLGN